MLTWKQGREIAREAGMRYAEPSEPGYPHNFEPLQMENSRWIHHDFFFADSVQECIEQKIAALPHPEYCLCDQCALERLAYCGDEEW